MMNDFLLMNGLAGSCTKAECYHFTNYKDPLNPFIGRGHFTVASVPGSHPAFRTASDEKLDESLGPRLTLLPKESPYLVHMNA